MESLGMILSFFKGKSVFITGHTGFKGAWLTKILVMAGAKVTGYALEPPTDVNLYDMLDIDEKIVSHIADIRDFESLKRAFFKANPEIVIHMAAQPIVRESYKEPVYTYETNVMGTVHILECVRMSKTVRSFLNVTTDKVYDNKEWDRGYVEEDYLDGYDPYSNSKSCAELVTHAYVRSFEIDCAISTARAGNVIGGGDFALDRLIPDCVRAAIAGEDMKIRNPHAIRPFQHVLEPLFVYLELLKCQYEDRTLQGTYNIGPDESDCVDVSQVVELFSDNWGNDFSYRIIEENGPHEAGFLKLDCTKIKEKLGWKPKLHVQDAIKLSCDWYLAYVAGADMDEVCKKQIEVYIRSI